MKIYLIIITLSRIALANDSFYTQTKNEKVIYQDENSVQVLVESPTDYNVTISDCGGFIMQLSIGDYALQTGQIPKVIEWRIDNKKKIIGVIVRTYEPVWNEEKGDFEQGKYTSILNVLSFENEIVLLGKVSGNIEARALIDKR
jgi:hypothetical protein